MADSQSGAHTLVGAVSFGFGCARVRYGYGLGMDMGIDVQGYVDLVQLLSGINNVDIWGRPSVKKFCFLDFFCTLYPPTFPCILSSYLSRIIFVEKNLSFGEISDF